MSTRKKSNSSARRNAARAQKLAKAKDRQARKLKKKPNGRLGRS